MSVFASRDLDKMLELAKSCENLWDINPDSLELLGDCENIVYKVKRFGQDFVLRITEPRHRNFGQLRNELNFILAAKEAGIKVCAPVASNNKKNIEEVFIGSDYCFVTLFEYAAGSFLAIEAKKLNEIYPMLGYFIGSLHEVSQKLPSSVVRHHFEESDHIKNWDKYLKDDEELIAAWKKYLNWYKQLDKTAESYGMAHIDLHRGNFHVNSKDEITAFDFDDCCQAFYAYDLAIPLFDLYRQMKLGKLSEAEFEKIKLGFFEGYETSFADGAENLKIVDQCIIFRHAEMYVWCLKMYDMDNLKDVQKEVLRLYRETMIKNQSAFL